MSIRDAYNSWSVQYDSNDNKTRDMEALALQQTLAAVEFEICLEIGCGTGKNTAWLAQQAKQIIAVDFAADMLAVAKEKIKAPNAQFIEADILQEWNFSKNQFDLVCFSLVLEHVEDLDAIFSKASGVIKPGGFIYIGELHPFKQYTGTKARFETEKELHILTCFNHHVSDFIIPAIKNGFEVVDLQEHFDEGDRAAFPRILSILFRRSGSVQRESPYLDRIG